MDKKYGIAVFIGRFQPFHKGHEHVIKEAKKIADRVLVLIGSANSSRGHKNPFSAAERQYMINAAVSDISIAALNDYTYEENQWLAEVQELVEDEDDRVKQDSSKPICVIGHTKDESSYYLKNFPQWEQVEVKHWETLNSTNIRDIYYSEVISNMHIENTVPKAVYDFMYSFAQTSLYDVLKKEYTFSNEYKNAWANTPFPPTFNTVDAVVVQSGHILLIKRGGEPGKGLWALPGGFLGQTETQLDAAIRELREETKLKVPVPVLKGSLKKEKTFDHPGRSSRGRTITQVFFFQLDNSLELPRVKGSDDAVFAKWVPLADFYDMAASIFEDHYHIIRYMIDNS